MGVGVCRWGLPPVCPDSRPRRSAPLKSLPCHYTPVGCRVRTQGVCRGFRIWCGAVRCGAVRCCGAGAQMKTPTFSVRGFSVTGLALGERVSEFTRFDHFVECALETIGNFARQG